jgi:ligand-binding sensor domain-containing protein
MSDILNRAQLVSALLWTGVLSLTGAGMTSAQSVDIESLLVAKECGTLARVEQQIVGGLANGGLLVWSLTDPTSYRRIAADAGLTSNQVNDLAYSGQFLWVATEGGGLTRFDIASDPPAHRQYTTNIGGLAITSVTGRVPGTSEVVYYGIRNGGIGVINAGLPGAIYTTADYDLVDDRVTDLAFYQGDLWIGTENGISRFASNVFTTQNTGLADLVINVLHAAADTLLLAGTNVGVYRWDDDLAAWSRLAGLGGVISSLTVFDDRIWVLKAGNTVGDRLYRWDDPGWTMRELPFARSRTLLTADGLWVAGENREDGMSVRTGRAFLARSEETGWTDYATREPLPMATDGVDFGPDGSLWLGSQSGDAVAWRDAAGWSNIFQLATVANDSLGLFATNDGQHGPNILGLVTRADGRVWFGQFRKGIIRFTPPRDDGQVPAEFDHIMSTNSALSHNRVVQLLAHPTGPLLILTDVTGVDVLVEPEAWPRSDRWVALPTGTDGLRGGFVRDGVIERNDIVWFIVDQVGLVRWDLNGPLLGPADELTWYNLDDDRWDEPVSSLPGTDFSFTGAKGLTIAPDGTIWVGGGGGVVQFRYNVSARAGTLLNEYGEKSDTFTEGLLTSTVEDITVDVNGDIWVACNAGLNRIRYQGETTSIDAYTSLTNYFLFGFGALYLPGIITGLPVGSEIWELTPDRTGQRLLAGTDRGAALIQVSLRQTGTGEPLASLFLYPNPFLADGSLLKLGGIEAEVDFVNGLPQGGAQVEVFNLEGQLVYRNENVAADTGFWDGRNRFGNAVASGLYGVKVTLGGQTKVHSLAVTR